MAQLLTKTDDKLAFERNFTDQYCYQCGQERVEAKPDEVFNTNFDSKTGGRLVVRVCNNLSCRLGCFRSGGHVFSQGQGLIYFFYGSVKCSRCGEKNPNCRF